MSKSIQKVQNIINMRGIKYCGLSKKTLFNAFIFFFRFFRFLFSFWSPHNHVDNIQLNNRVKELAIFPLFWLKFKSNSL